MNIRRERTGTTLNILVALVKDGKVYALKEFNKKGCYYQYKVRQYKSLGYKIEAYDVGGMDMPQF